MKTKFKVALVAAASNEAAYVTDWIFHHLRFGFAPILIYVNRSQDGTEALLREIAKSVPELRVYNIDDVDTLPVPLAPQRTAYERARLMLKKEQGRGDYTTFADIDEFWTPADFTSSVQEVLAAAGKPMSATFNWFQLVTDVAPFARPLEAKMRGMHYQLIKTMFRSRLRVSRFSVHGVKPLLPWPIWNASGCGVARKFWFKSIKRPKQAGAAMLIHRLYRSPLEYLAILGRGRSNFPDLLFKNNREGYHHLIHRKNRPMDDFHIEQSLFELYEQDRLAFRARLDMNAMLLDAEETVRTRARAVLKTYLALDPEGQKKWQVQFDYLDLEDLKSQLGLN